MISEIDRRELQEQLGRSPRGVLNVSSRCPEGHPAVVRTKPLIRSGGGFEIFPTLFWLTCPEMVRKVSSVEAIGYIERLERELRRSSQMRSKYRKQTEDYRGERWNMLSSQERAFISKRGLKAELEKGIGGVGDVDHLKCLHMHVAHHLARENIIGKLVLERFAIRKCPEPHSRDKQAV